MSLLPALASFQQSLVYNLVMKKQSAGLLVYRLKNGQPQVLIVHIGGPWMANKDKGAWTIPKGEYEASEDPLKVAYNEFAEELSKKPPASEPLPLGTIEQKNNKTVIAWAIEGDLDLIGAKSNTVKIEWPPKSGKIQEFPEVDKPGWYSLEAAAQKLLSAQVPLLQRLAEHLNIDFDPAKGEQPSLF